MAHSQREQADDLTLYLVGQRGLIFLHQLKRVQSAITIAVGLRAGSKVPVGAVVFCARYRFAIGFHIRSQMSRVPRTARLQLTV